MFLIEDKNTYLLLFEGTGDTPSSVPKIKSPVLWMFIVGSDLK
jgi:hypothetical protein